MARLSETELFTLRDYAALVVLEAAADRLRNYDPERCERTEEEIRQEEHELMIASAEVYGPLRNAELAFSDLGTGRDTPESVEVSFTETAMDWLRQLQEEIRRGLVDSRGTVEAREGTTFLLFILDGICGGAS